MTEIKASSLASMIIELGPFTPGQENPLAQALTMASNINSLRDELMELRALQRSVKAALCVQCSHSSATHVAGRCIAPTLCPCTTWYPMSHAYPLTRRDSDG